MPFIRRERIAIYVWSKTTVRLVFPFISLNELALEWNRHWGRNGWKLFVHTIQNVYAKYLAENTAEWMVKMV